MYNPSIDLRSAFERAQAKFPGNVISRGVIRLEQALDAQKNQYTFKVKDGSTSGTEGANQIKLSDNDAFVLVAIALGIKRQDGTNTGTQPIYTYPDPQVFTGAPASQPKEYEALLTAFNGQLSFTTGTVQRIKPLDTADFLMVPGDQVIKQASPAINDSLPPFGPSHQERGFIEIQPTILLDGAQANDFTLTLGAGNLTGITGQYTAAGATTNTHRNYMVLRLLGFFVHEGAASAKRLVNEWR
jgi:hypothetical protein